MINYKRADKKEYDGEKSWIKFDEVLMWQEPKDNEKCKSIYELFSSPADDLTGEDYRKLWEDENTLGIDLYGERFENKK